MGNCGVSTLYKNKNINERNLFYESKHVMKYENSDVIKIMFVKASPCQSCIQFIFITMHAL